MPAATPRADRVSIPAAPGESRIRSYNVRNKTYGGAMASTWSVLRVSCKRRSPVGLLKQPEPMQVRITISHSLPKS